MMFKAAFLVQHLTGGAYHVDDGVRRHERQPDRGVQRLALVARADLMVSFRTIFTNAPRRRICPYGTNRARGGLKSSCALTMTSLPL